MWISRKRYKQLKQERNDALYESSVHKMLYNDLKRDMINLQVKYNKTLKLFEVDIYLQILNPITYKIKTSSPEEAEQCAIKMFTDKNKDFSASDIVMVTVKPISCAK